MTDNVDDDEVAKIVSDPNYAFRVNQFNQLMAVLQDVIDSTDTCDPPVLDVIGKQFPRRHRKPRHV